MGNNPSAITRPSLQKNVVERSVGKMQAAFIKKKLSSRNASNKIEAAAQVLLKGMTRAKLGQNVSLSAYADTVSDRDTLNADIQFATGHIVQTTKAAEVFLETATDDMTLRKELQNLERALSVSYEATERLTLAMEKMDIAESNVLQTTLDQGDTWIAFKTSVDSLRSVTDKFGDRVRSPLSPVISVSNAAS